MKRRYEVWFLRCGLADGGGAWWFRYLLLNRGRGGCGANPTGMPALPGARLALADILSGGDQGARGGTTQLSNNVEGDSLE